MRRLCLFTGGFAAAAGLYLFLLHGAPGVLLAALAAVCALLFLLRRPILRRAAVCVLGLLAGGACVGAFAYFGKRKHEKDGLPTDPLTELFVNDDDTI